MARVLLNEVEQHASQVGRLPVACDVRPHVVEPTVRQRFEQSAYVKGASSFRYSEELAYDTTPRRMVKRLLASRAHRAVVLDPAFEDLGVGARRGAPVAGVNGHRFITYTLEFAARTK